MEDISLAYEKIGGLIKRLEISKDGTTSHLIDSDRDLEYIKQQRKQKVLGILCMLTRLARMLIIETVVAFHYAKPTGQR